MDPIIGAAIIAVVGGLVGVVLGAVTGTLGGMALNRATAKEAGITRTADRLYELADALLREADHHRLMALNLVKSKQDLAQGIGLRSDLLELGHPTTIRSARLTLGFVSAAVEPEAIELERATMRVAQLARELPPGEPPEGDDDELWQDEWPKATRAWMVALDAFRTKVKRELGVVAVAATA